MKESLKEALSSVKAQKQGEVRLILAVIYSGLAEKDAAYFKSDTFKQHLSLLGIKTPAYVDQLRRSALEEIGDE